MAYLHSTTGYFETRDIGHPQLLKSDAAELSRPVAG